MVWSREITHNRECIFNFLIAMKFNTIVKSDGFKLFFMFTYRSYGSSSNLFNSTRSEFLYNNKT